MRAAAIAGYPPAYDFTNQWFAPHVVHWRELFERIKPARLLEVGCYEGQATTFMLGAAACHGDVHMTCIDTWEGGADLPPEAMAGVEERFDSNIAIAFGRTTKRIDFHKFKMPSAKGLARLLIEAREPYDFIYIDGSHTAPDVLTDAVLAFQLLRFGGAMVFDDYAWQFEPQGRQDALNMPKPAIDAFINLNLRRLSFAPFGAGHAQMLVLKACR